MSRNTQTRSVQGDRFAGCKGPPLSRPGSHPFAPFLRHSFPAASAHVRYLDQSLTHALTHACTHVRIHPYRHEYQHTRIRYTYTCTHTRIDTKKATSKGSTAASMNSLIHTVISWWQAMHSSPLQAALQQQKLAAGAGVGSKNVWVAIKVVRLCPVPGSVGGGSSQGWQC